MIRPDWPSGRMVLDESDGVSVVVPVVVCRGDGVDRDITVPIDDLRWLTFEVGVGSEI